MDNRAVSPVVEKSLAVGLTLLFVAGMTSVLLSGVVPDYRTAAGGEMADRVLATAAGEIEGAVPAVEGDVDVRVEAELPGTIRNSGYSLVLDGRTLRLDHPNDVLDRSTTLSVPDSLSTDASRWNGGPLVIRVIGPASSRTLTLEP